MILAVACSKGRVHDFKLFKQARLKINPAAAIYADLGFLGLQKLHPKTVLPFRASKLHALSKDEKQHNRQAASTRVKVEHINRECKIFRIVKDTYRGKHKNYGLNWNLIAALNNLKKACHHFDQATP